MKKKRKRSASSSSTSSSSSSSDSSSSTSSSSSSRRRSKKKKKKKKRKGSKRRRRISSKDSRKSDQSKKSKQEDEDVEWYPAPPITSATFLNQTGGPGFRVKDVFTKSRDGQNRRISISDEEEVWKRRSTKDESRKDCSSPNHKDETRSRWDSEAKRRDSFEDKRRVSTSSADSEHSRRSEYPKYPWSEASARRGSLDGGRYERGNGERASVSGTKADDKAKTDGPKKELPANLLDIFNQIEQFQKEKGVRPKK